MNKEVKVDMWDIDSTKPAAKITTPKVEAAKQSKAIVLDVVASEWAFDMEGLMTDFPTATELQKFVYDQTGVVLNLKGRANKVKYQIALDTLNGQIPPAEFLGSENPYLDKNEIIPEEPLKVLPPRDVKIDNAGGEVTRFGTSVFPHPDQDWAASDTKCQVVFRKYANSMITYEVLGPIAKKAVGTRINKYGAKTPERIVWVDCRTGEQIIRDENNKLTPLGTRLRGFMMKQRVNKSNQWDTWIDRDFVVTGDMNLDNPWATL
jgi:hypothetical protein